MTRCAWANGSDMMKTYHDNVWGKPVFDDLELFEMLNLEGQQAGLSWSTILARREGYREAFGNFNPYEIAKYTEEDVERLLLNPGIIRNRLKVNAIIRNARAFCKLVDEIAFSDYLWSYVNHTPLVNHHESMETVPASTELSERISKDLKKRGFTFVGPTIIYAFMQAVGIVNDHLDDCEYK